MNENYREEQRTEKISKESIDTKDLAKTNHEVIFYQFLNKNSTLCKVIILSFIYCKEVICDSS